MLAAEADRIREILLARDDVSPLLNVGSSTRRYREEEKPHIEGRLFGPLRAAGVDVTNMDVKAADGVDLVGDILDPALQRELEARGFRCVLLANLLEHVRDRGAVITACEQIGGRGGLVLATVPSSYPYHADPIDTLYRPTPAELAAAFSRCRPLLAEEVAGPSFAEDLRARGLSPAGQLLRTLGWALIAFARPRSFLARAHRWFWFARPSRVSIVLMAVD